MVIDRLAVAWGVAWIGVIGMGAVGPAAAQTSGGCRTELSAAEWQYQNGAFDESIRLISECLDQDRVSSEQTVRAYRMLALAHLKRDELTAARSAIINLLSTNPNYAPDRVEEPPVYVSMVSLVRRELNLGPSSVSIQAVQPLPLAVMEVEIEMDRLASLGSPRAGAPAAEDSTRSSPKIGW